MPMPIEDYFFFIFFTKPPLNYVNEFKNPKQKMIVRGSFPLFIFYYDVEFLLRDIT